jgi:hypothetical protein
VASHPEWSRDQAIADGRANNQYLKGVELSGGKAVVSVTWAAAQAYCSDHGGLAPVDQAPVTWVESSTGLFQEWRSAGGARAWLRFDGDASQQVTAVEANAFTGFRCRR